MCSVNSFLMIITLKFKTVSKQTFGENSQMQLHLYNCRKYTLILILNRSAFNLRFCRGMTFKWLLENSPGYAGFIVADTEKEEPSQNNLWLHKMALKKYMEMFEEGVYILQSKQKDESHS